MKEFTAKTIVTQEKTALRMGSGNLEVFATPCMVALMEQAAAACVSDTLPAGSTTVGTQISVSHVKASPLGAEIAAKAVLTAQEGRTYTFSVEAYEGETLIGSGTHTRVMVDAERFMSKLNK